MEKKEGKRGGGGEDGGGRQERKDEPYKGRAFLGLALSLVSREGAAR